MSASPPIATVGCQNLFGRKGPERDVREFGAHQTKNPRALPWGFLILLCLPLKLVSDASANRIDRKITPSERNR